MNDGPLWEGIELPEWNLQVFFKLYLRFKGRNRTRIEEDEFCRMLMFQVAVHANKLGWRRTFAQHNIDPQDAGAEVVKALIPKLLRVKLRHPCPLVLIQTLNLAINNELKSVVRAKNRKSAIPTQNEAEDFEHADISSASPTIDGLLRAMKDAEEEVCPNYRVVKLAYRRMCESVVRGKNIPTIEEMPRKIRDSIVFDDFALVAFRLGTIIDRYAQDLASAAC